MFRILYITLSYLKSKVSNSTSLILVVLYGCETWFLNLQDKRLRDRHIWTSEVETDSNRKLKKLHNEELRNFTVKQICVYIIFAFVQAIFSCNASVCVCVVTLLTINSI